MNRVLDGFVLNWENFDPHNNLVEEKFRKNVVSSTTDSFLPTEAEVYAVFHHEETLLAAIALETIKELVVNLG